MSTSSTLAVEYEFQPARTPRSAEVNANFAAIIELINTTGLGTNNFKLATFTSAKLTAGCAVDSKFQDLGITKAKQEALNIIYGSDQASYDSGTSASLADITGSSVTITTTGRPVVYGLLPINGSSQSEMTGVDTSNNFVRFCRDATVLGQAANYTGPISSLRIVDHPAAGTYTYNMKVTTTFTALVLTNFRPFAYEIF